MTPASSVQGYVTTAPPKSPRAASFTDMLFQPGIVSNAPSRNLKGRYVASNRVRFHKGFPEKIGGWIAQALSGASGSTYIGTARAATDWASLDGQYWIAFATECKLYLINNSVLYDITPIRQTSNTTNVFSTVNTQTLVTVTDVNHRANQGDHMTVLGPIAVGGITLNGDYDIVTVIDPNTYTINQATPATGTVNLGGGAVTLEYDVSCGLATNGQLTGYGTALYGGGTYGTPRAPGTGVPAKMRTWSLSNWGQDLVASYNNGELYWWQWSSGPNSRAAIVANAPTDIQRLLVNADSRFLIAVGASDVDGNADPMNVRWCSEDDLNDWLPVILPVANTAGGQRLNFGSRMVTGLQSRQQNLLWSDTQMYQMQFSAASINFGFNELGKCYLVGPNAAIDVNGVVYMMCFDDFQIYDGTLRVLPCEMWESVFGPPGQPGLGFDRSQAEMVYCASFMLKSEVTWFYPAADGADTMQYVTYNYDLGVWYGGTMPRTCYHDVTPALAGFVQYPYAFNAGNFYQHEVGFDEHEPAGVVNAMDWFLQSWDIGAQADRPMLINSIIPEFGRLRNGVQFSYLCKEYPEDTPLQVGPFIVTPTTTRIDERAAGAQTALLLEAAVVDPPSLLLHFDAGTGSTVFADSSENAFTMTVVGAAAIEDATVKFGEGAGDFDGSSAYIESPIITPGTPLDVGNGDFTLEFWAYPLSLAGTSLPFAFSRTDVNGTSGFIEFVTPNKVLAAIHGGVSGAGVPGATSLAINSWHHIALTAQGTTAHCFVDGVEIPGSPFVGGVLAPFASNVRISIGAEASAGGQQFFHGHIDEVRIVKGTAIYTANFTPPVAPFTNGIVFGQDFRLGVWQTLATPHGKRLGVGSRGSAINTSNP